MHALVPPRHSCVCVHFLYLVIQELLVKPKEHPGWHCTDKLVCKLRASATRAGYRGRPSRGAAWQQGAGMLSKGHAE